MNLDSAILRRIEFYREHEVDTTFLDELALLEKKQDEQELSDRFYTELEFGTGGIRGIIGAGTNRLNPLIVKRVAAGWAQYLVNQCSDERITVVLAYDSRKYSDVFANLVSEVLVANNIKVYRYVEPRPTPQLSFTIRALDAHSGMVITASHNPPMYNGLKIYWNDGAQMVTPHDTGVMDAIDRINPPFPYKDLETAKKEGLYEELEPEWDDRFRDYAGALLFEPSLFKEYSHYKVVYTPLHGTGSVHMEALAQRYHIDCIIEPSQKAPDGEFPTVVYPNPEDPKALVNAIETAKIHNVNLVIATDPDADRVGLAERVGNDFVCLTGNQTGSLLLDYVLSQRKKRNHLNNKSTFINTIVTSPLQEKIAVSYGVTAYKTYTGFKNIAAVIKKLEETNHVNVFSCEESYGYLPSMAVRDKDGIATALLCIEMAQYYHKKGLSLLQKLDTIYQSFGYHEEWTINKNLLGKEGREKINVIMETLRDNFPRTLAGENIVTVFDFLHLKETSLKTGITQSFAIPPLTLPPSNVLIFVTESGNRLCVRPSGTEPKIKLYLLYHCSVEGSKNIAEAREHVRAMMQKADTDVQEWLQ